MVPAGIIVATTETLGRVDLGQENLGKNTKATVQYTSQGINMLIAREDGAKAVEVHKQQFNIL